MPIFFVGKASLIFSTKNITVFGYKVVKHLRRYDALNNRALIFILKSCNYILMVENHGCMSKPTQSLEVKVFI